MALWDSFLEARPEAGYAAWLNPSSRNAPSTFLPAMQRQYEPLWNRYLGTIGNDVREGRTPTLSWMDYLGSWDPRNYFRGLSAYEKGQTVFAPNYRFLGGF